MGNKGLRIVIRHRSHKIVIVHLPEILPVTIRRALLVIVLVLLR